MTSARSARGAAALLAALGCLAASAQSGPQSGIVQALASNGVRAPLEVLVPRCERTLGRHVKVEYSTSAAIREHLMGGTSIDVVFATTEVIGELAAAGRVASNSITPLGRAGIGVGVRKGARHFDITSSDAMKQSLLAATSVTYAQDGASRPHIERMFERLGITAEMQAKAQLEQGSVRAAARVVNGDAEMLLTLVSEILPVEGMELVGPLPAEFQSYVSFAAARGTQTAEPEAARSLVTCIAAPSATATFAAKGVTR